MMEIGICAVLTKIQELIYFTSNPLQIDKEMKTIPNKNFHHNTAPKTDS